MKHIVTALNPFIKDHQGKETSFKTKNKIVKNIKRSRLIIDASNANKNETQPRHGHSESQVNELEYYNKRNLVRNFLK